MFFYKIVVFILFFASILGFAQEMPPIVNYNPSIYDAGNQNWMISQDKNQFLYWSQK